MAKNCPPCCDHSCDQGDSYPYNKVPLEMYDLFVAAVAVLIFIVVVFGLAGYVWGMK